MSYPQYPDDEVAPAFISHLDIHSFFKRRPPSQWRPEKFAFDPTALSMGAFLQGLFRINKANTSNIACYAGRCRAFLRTEDGGVLLSSATDTLTLRLAQDRATKQSLRQQKAGETSLLESLEEG